MAWIWLIDYESDTLHYLILTSKDWLHSPETYCLPQSLRDLACRNGLLLAFSLPSLDQNKARIGWILGIPWALCRHSALVLISWGSPGCCTPLLGVCPKWTGSRLSSSFFYWFRTALYLASSSLLLMSPFSISSTGGWWVWYSEGGICLWSCHPLIMDVFLMFGDQAKVEACWDICSMDSSACVDWVRNSSSIVMFNLTFNQQVSSLSPTCLYHPVGHGSGSLLLSHWYIIAGELNQSGGQGAWPSVNTGGASLVPFPSSRKGLILNHLVLSMLWHRLTTLCLSPAALGLLVGEALVWCTWSELLSCLAWSCSQVHTLHLQTAETPLYYLSSATK